jgi:hypothetical protein
MSDLPARGKEILYDNTTQSGTTRRVTPSLRLHVAEGIAIWCRKEQMDADVRCWMWSTTGVACVGLYMISFLRKAVSTEALITKKRMRCVKTYPRLVRK